MYPTSTFDFGLSYDPFQTGKSSDQVTVSLWLYTKQGLLAKGFLLPTLSTSILFICFWIDLIPTRVSDDRKYVFSRRLYARINTRKFKASIPEKLHHCQRSKKWFTWHIISIISENKPQYYINTNEIPGELSRENLIFTCENNMLSSHVKISVSPLLWLHNKSRLSHQKTIKVKWFGTLLVFI